MNILSWNVNGLMSRYSNGYLDWFFDESSDILCVQETKGSEDKFRSLIEDLDGHYSFYSKNVSSNNGGVAVYSKMEPLRVSESLGYRKFPGRVLC